LPVGHLVVAREAVRVLRQREHLAEVLLDRIRGACPEIALKLVDGRVVLTNLGLNSLNRLVMRGAGVPQLAMAFVLRVLVLSNCPLESLLGYLAGPGVAGLAADKPG
jgi:hypothetical protein